jgi:Flp pilus assembly protein TadG
MRAGQPEPARLSSDRGAVLVEAGLALPLLLFLVLGMVDFGYAAFRQSQYSSAARDGARVAILEYKGADVTGSADWQRIDQAVRARLGGSAVLDMTARCYRPGSASPITCASATPDVDLVEVRVSWRYQPISPAGSIIGDRTFTSSSRMLITGKPEPTTIPDAPIPPPPDPVVSVNSTTFYGGQTLVVSGSGLQPGASVTIEIPGLLAATNVTVGPDGSFSLSVPIAPGTPLGNYQVQVQSTVYGEPRTFGPFPFSVTNPPACQATSVTASPDPVGKKGNGTLKKDLTITVQTNGSPLCTNLSVFVQVSNTAGQSFALNGTSSPYSVTIGASQLNTWTGGTKTIIVRWGSTTIGTGTFTVN